jgi:translocator protein
VTQGRLWLQVLVGSVAAAGVAGTGAALTRLGPWYFGLKKPWFQPPDWLFGPAWTTIFICCVIAGVWAWRRTASASQRSLIILLFALNATLNVLWSALFFYLQRPDWALWEVGFLWLSILLLIVYFWSWARRSAHLLMPYLAWVTFASVLNIAIVQLNAPFTGRV